jgi:hypothetical protein
MAKDWRCLIGLHDWREVEMPDRDKCAECTRCGKRDWCRLLTRTAGKWRGATPAGGVGRSTSRHAGMSPADIVNVSSEAGSITSHNDPASPLSQMIRPPCSTGRPGPRSTCSPPCTPGNSGTRRSGSMPPTRQAYLHAAETRKAPDRPGPESGLCAASRQEPSHTLLLAHWGSEPARR